MSAPTPLSPPLQQALHDTMRTGLMATEIGQHFVRSCEPVLFGLICCLLPSHGDANVKELAEALHEAGVTAAKISDACYALQEYPSVLVRASQQVALRLTHNLNDIIATAADALLFTLKNEAPTMTMERVQVEHVAGRILCRALLYVLQRWELLFGAGKGDYYLADKSVLERRIIHTDALRTALFYVTLQSRNNGQHNGQHNEQHNGQPLIVEPTMSKTLFSPIVNVSASVATPKTAPSKPSEKPNVKPSASLKSTNMLACAAPAKQPNTPPLPAPAKTPDIKSPTITFNVQGTQFDLLDCPE